MIEIGNDGLSIDDSEISEYERELDCSCCSEPCWKRFFLKIFIVLLICGNLAGVLYLLIELDIMPFKIAQNDPIITREPSFSSTSFNFTTYTTTDQNSSIFEYNSSDG
jgi:hypothetical protein